MKTKTFISAITLMVTLMACENSSTQTELITIDVEKSYPKKELIIDDLWKVEYIALTPSPFIVRTPRVKETEPNKILRFESETDEWMFLSGIEMAYDFSKNEGLHQTNYGVEKASGEIYELKFIHPDYEGKEYSPTALNARYYPADELLTALEEGKLKGKLKEIASTLDEEDNGVVMLLKQK